jgi:hypothetical protein
MSLNLMQMFLMHVGHVRLRVIDGLMDMLMFVAFR